MQTAQCRVILHQNTFPLCKNAVSTLQFLCKLLSFTLKDSFKKLADDQYSSITKGTIYHIKHLYIKHFTTVAYWPEIGCLMEVSTMFYTCRYCVLTWWGSCFDLLTEERWHMWGKVKISLSLCLSTSLGNIEIRLYKVIISRTSTVS